MAARYEIDNEVRVTGTFRDGSSAVLDPTNVYVEITEPDGKVTEYTYGVGATITKSSTGIYYVDVTLDKEGRWYVRFHSTGNAVTSGTESFICRSGT